jgi:hypothetical protein
VREYLEALDRAAAAEEANCADDGDASPPGNPTSEPKYTDCLSVRLRLAASSDLR